MATEGESNGGVKHIHSQWTTLFFLESWMSSIGTERVFGFGIKINYNKSSYENTIEIVLRQSKNVFRCNEINSAIHGPFPSDINLPARTKSLSGLGFKFCIKLDCPYQDLCTALRQFKQSVDLRSWLIEMEVKPDNSFVWLFRIFSKQAPQQSSHVRIV